MNAELSEMLKKSWATLARSPQGAHFALIPDPNTPVLVLSKRAEEVAPNKILALLRTQNHSVQAASIYVGRTRLEEGEVQLVVDAERSRGPVNLEKVGKALRLVAKQSGVQQVVQATGVLDERLAGQVIDGEVPRDVLGPVDEIVEQSREIGGARVEVQRWEQDPDMVGMVEGATARALGRLLKKRLKREEPLAKEEQALVLARLEALAGELSTGAKKEKVERLLGAVAGLMDHMLAGDEADPDAMARAGALHDRLALQLEALTARRPEVDVDGLELGPEIGRGGLGSIHSVEGPGGLPLVAKVMLNDDRQALEDFALEQRAFQRLDEAGLGDHPCFVKWYGSVERDGKPTMFLESVQGGDVEGAWGRLQQMRTEGSITEPEYWGAVQHVIKGLLQGLEALHRAGFSHMDVKPGNVMLTDDGQVKIIDLGSMLGEEDEHFVGMTQNYTAPEVGPYHKSTGTDVWAVGATLFERLTGQLFEGRGERGHHGISDWAGRNEDAIVETDEPLRDELGRPVGDEGRVGRGGAGTAFVDLVNKLMHVDPNQRITAEEALSHPFLTDTIVPPEEARGLLAKPRGVPAVEELLVADAALLAEVTGFVGDLRAKPEVAQNPLLREALIEKLVDLQARAVESVRELRAAGRDLRAGTAAERDKLKERGGDPDSVPDHAELHARLDAAVEAWAEPLDDLGAALSAARRSAGQDLAPPPFLQELVERSEDPEARPRTFLLDDFERVVRESWEWIDAAPEALRLGRDAADRFQATLEDVERFLAETTEGRPKKELRVRFRKRHAAFEQLGTEAWNVWKVLRALRGGVDEDGLPDDVRESQRERLDQVRRQVEEIRELEGLLAGLADRVGPLLARGRRAAETLAARG